jgi:2-oxoglutarate dehydrogenase E1 component
MNRLIATKNLVKLAINSQKLKHTSTILQTTKPASAAVTDTIQNLNFINGSSTTYIEEVYESWLQNPSSVHKSWDIYFRTGNYQSPPTLGAPLQQQQQQQQLQISNLNDLLAFIQKNTQAQPSATLVPSSPEEKLIEDHLRLYALIRAFQIRGHKLASLDPLGILKQDITGEVAADLKIDYYNFTEADLSRKFKLPKTTYIGGEETTLELGEILNRLKVRFFDHKLAFLNFSFF